MALELTQSLVVFTDYLKNMVEQNMVTLGVQDVFYGEQTKYPRTPAVALESDTKRREINGAPRRTENDLNAFIIIYHSPVSDVQKTRRDVDLLAEAIENLVHSDSRLGGLVIHSLVDQMQSGYATRGGTQYRSCRLSVSGKSQSQLPLARIQ